MPAPDYDGRMVWFPRLERLLPGDILLTRTVYDEVAGGTKDAKLIRAVTFGRFEHAAICTAPPTVAEAGGDDDGGVFTLSLARCFAHDLENVRVLRWPDGEVAARAAAYCQRQVGRPYSRIKAITSVLPLAVVTDEDRGVFCSSLVAHAFKTADPTAFAKLNPNKMSPSGLGRLKGFKDITEQMFSEGLAPRNAEEMTALDGVRAWTPAYEQTLSALQYAKILLPMTDAFVEAFPEAGLSRPETFNDVLAQLPNAVDAVTRIPPARRSDYVAALGAIDGKAADLLADGRLAGSIREMIDMDRTARRKMLAKSFDTNPDIDLDHQAALLVARQRTLVARQEAHAWFAPYTSSLRSIQLWEALTMEATRETEAAMAEQADVLRRLRPGLPPNT